VLIELDGPRDRAIVLTSDLVRGETLKVILCGPQWPLWLKSKRITKEHTEGH